MFSVPAANTQLASPNLISLAALKMASIPDPQSLFKTKPGVSCLHPNFNARCRPPYIVSVDEETTLPRMT